MSNPLTSPLNATSSHPTLVRAPVAVERPGLPSDRQTPAVTGQSPPPAGTTVAEPNVSSEALTQAVSDINNYVQSVRRELQFSIDETLGRTVIKVLDSETQEIVRQIPTEEVLALARYLSQLEDKQVEGLFLQARV
ncbi:MAG: flagellar protein FlaG [Gammaproteobacteria bacterium]